MSTLLPPIRDAKHYLEIFPQTELWDPAIRHLASHYDLSGKVERASSGSHIVYQVGRHWIKLMAPIFAKDLLYEQAGLESVSGKLNVNSPVIQHKGALEDWPYLIISHVPGKGIGEIWPKLSLGEKTDLAAQMSVATLSLQKCQAKELIVQRGEWNSFILDRLKNNKAHHQSKNMDPRWLDQLESFLKKFDPDEFTTTHPVFLHSDLTKDHFLIDRTEEGLQISGIIDFADCRVGHPEYDIPATAAFILKGESEALREYLLQLGHEASQLNSRFSEKMMAWTLLHYYSNLKNYFEKEMQEVPAGDFAALSKKVYPLDL